MRRTLSTVALLCLVAAGAAAGTRATLVADQSDPTGHQQSLLLDRSVLPAGTVRPGSPPSGAFFTATNRHDAAVNGVVGPATGAYFAQQPVQGISATIPAGDGTWWALADNGYGTRDTSADWQLVIYRLDLHFGEPGGPTLVQTVVLSDPGGFVPWKTVCDPTHGSDLPPFTFNVLPATPPPACGADPAARILTGFDFDPESLEVAADGSFWIGEEFGPYLLHADTNGRLLEAPVDVPGARSPQNATLDVLAGERPTVAQSRGLESMAISPDRRTLYPMFEGAVGSDDPQDLRILSYDVKHHRFGNVVRRLRLEMPGAKVNLSTLTLVGGAPAYPGTTPPTGTGGESAAELTSVNAHQFLVVERDSNGDGVPAPRFKKIFLVDRDPAGPGSYVSKSLLVDLMAIPDPHRVGGDGDFFRFPFNTIESVHVADDHSVLVANDNNYPFSAGRSLSLTNARTGPTTPDDNEFILVGLGSPLKVDPRLLSPPVGAG